MSYKNRSGDYLAEGRRLTRGSRHKEEGGGKQKWMRNKIMPHMYKRL